jgi:hypothetical protein
VWLAQKTDSSEAFVAVKVSTAEDSQTTKSNTFKAVSEMQANNGQSPHILTFFDHFTLHGPNGTHSVLVTEVVVPILPLLSRKCPRPPLWFKVAAHGLTQAVAQLHAAKVVHGGTSPATVNFTAHLCPDLHLSNVGVTIPQLVHQDQDDIMQDLTDYNLTIVLPTSAANQIPSLPAYLVEPCNLAAYYDEISPPDLPQTKLFDFGNGESLSP